jgi:hypothetical protein
MESERHDESGPSVWRMLILRRTLHDGQLAAVSLNSAIRADSPKIAVGVVDEKRGVRMGAESVISAIGSERLGDLSKSELEHTWIWSRS